MRLLFLSIFLFCTFLLNAQQFKTIEGQVIDSLSLKPVAFAHLYIVDKNYGTVTNEDGRFKLSLEEQHNNDQLTISCIGYNTRRYAVKDLLNSESTIRLSAAMQLLPEVIVDASKADTLKDYLSSVIKKIKTNYPKHKYILDAFYRELSVNDTTYTRLLEAAISIGDNGYSPHDFDKEDLTVTKTRIKVHEVRKSDDMRTYTFFGKVLEFIFGKENNLYKVLVNDFIRYIGRDANHFLSAAMLEKYEYELKGIYNSPSGRTIVIGLSDQHIKSFFYREVTIYINEKDNAIVKIENVLKPSEADGKDNKNYAFRGEFFAKSEVAYSFYKGKYYLQYIDAWYYSAGGATPVLDKEGSDKKALQFDHLSLMVNAVYNKEDDFKKIKQRESVQKDVDLYSENHPYNPEFWKYYNVLLLNPINDNAKKDLEKQRKLEDQFIIKH